MLTALLLLIWLAAGAILAFWTLAAWGISALAKVDWTSATAAEAALRDTVGKWLSGTPLEPWQPMLEEFARSTVQFAAGAGAWLPTLTWTVWGIGVVVMLVLAILASLIAAWVVRTFRPSKPAPT
ncbi:MAG: hypothetical protein RL341_544 [Pseudomonadota bacterium]|jgi:ABC-type antimicrobial peptide transport system permease subunit